MMMMMKESIRCCISCILPCGALDVIRIVHANGRVEEISGSVSAADIMQAYPKHALRRPPSPPRPPQPDGTGAAAAALPKAAILPPDAELQKGKIYFLVPAAEKARPGSAGAGTRRRRKKKELPGAEGVNYGAESDRTRLLLNERYLSEILSEKAAPTLQRDRRRGRVAVWRPHLESISEASGDL